MNKEQLRKELEDCWAVACKWFEIAGGPPEKFIANRDTYINGKLAEVQNYESLAQDAIRDIDLITDFADFGAKEKLGMIEKAILKYWEDCKKPITTHLAALDDGDGKVNPTEDEIAEFIKTAFQVLTGRDKFQMMDFILDSKFRIRLVDDGQEGKGEQEREWQRNLTGIEALPVADGEGEKDELIKMQDDYIEFLELESTPFIQFAAIHGMEISKKVVETGKSHRTIIALLKTKIETRPR